jgi:hypothetical protein
MDQTRADAEAVAGIEVTGQTSRPHQLILKLDLFSGQLTSPCIVYDWRGGMFVGLVANVAGLVRVLVYQLAPDGAQVAVHEAKVEGKPEGPGLQLCFEGDTLRYVVTEHGNVQADGSRANRLWLGEFRDIAAPAPYAGPFADEAIMGAHTDNVYAVVEHGLMSANAEKDFNAEVPMPRMQIATVLARMLRIKRRA